MTTPTRQGAAGRPLRIGNPDRLCSRVGPHSTRETNSRPTHAHDASGRLVLRGAGRSGFFGFPHQQGCGYEILGVLRGRDRSGDRRFDLS